MRSKIVFAVLGLGLAGLLLAFLLWPAPAGVKPAAGAAPEATIASSAGGASASSSPPAVQAVKGNQSPATLGSAAVAAPDQAVPGPANAVMANPAEPKENTAEARRKEYVETRIQELQDLAMEDDQASLNTIISELTGPDPEIRRAAIDATVQFGSRDAIPGLEAAEMQLADPKEKAAIAEAIEFLNLPKLSELKKDGEAAPAPASRH